MNSELKKSQLMWVEKRVELLKNYVAKVDASDAVKSELAERVLQTEKLKEEISEIEHGGDAHG